LSTVFADNPELSSLLRAVLPSPGRPPHPVHAREADRR
jgi:hypothetical protein